MARHAHHGNDHGKPKINGQIFNKKRTHGYCHETRPVLDCTRVRVSRRTSSFSLAHLKVQKVHNVHNSPIGTSRSVFACAQPAHNRSTVILIKTGPFMTYPTIHTCISFC